MENGKILTVNVDDLSDVGIRLDKFLSTKTDLSRSRVISLIKYGCLSPNLDADTKVSFGQTFELRIPECESARPLAQDIPLDVLYEDADIIVLNKPCGMVVHPGAGNHSGTLVNALLAHCGDTLSGIGGVKRPGIVHRIDKETSGVLVIAKNDTAHQHLSEQFSVHSIHRVYYAVVYGFPPVSGTVRGNIGRSSVNRQKMAIVQQGGKSAVTHFRLVKPLFNGKASLIECRLETGRTHQIRVHMTSIGHPLVGDKTYGSAPKGTIDLLKLFPRQALHAAQLGFKHPTNGKELLFKAPLPQDFKYTDVTVIVLLSTVSSGVFGKFHVYVGSSFFFGSYAGSVTVIVLDSTVSFNVEGKFHVYVGSSFFFGPYVGSVTVMFLSSAPGTNVYSGC